MNLFSRLKRLFDGRGVVEDEEFRGAIGSADLISFLGVFPTKIILNRGDFQYGDYVHINSTKNQGTFAYDGERWVLVDCKYIHGENPPPPTVHDTRVSGVDPGSLGT